MKKEPETKRTKFSRILFERDISLTEINKATGVSYPTLENLKFGRPINFRHRTLRDVASYLDITIEEFLEDSDDAKYNTAFERAIDALSKKKDTRITLQKIHQSTGVSLPILTSLKKGIKKNYMKRTIRDLAVYLEVSEEELLDNDAKETMPKDDDGKDGIIIAE